MSFSAADHRWMAEALRLAERGLWTTSPNPRVGCVLVQGDTLVGEGWHEKAGEPHAEVHALRAAGVHARGATAYVTLEPCSHFGRTGPCADALIAAGVGRVVAAMADPNPQVAGAGLARLNAAGIPSCSGLLEGEARELNLGFVSRMTRGRPWLRLKAAASLDGKTALPDGQSQWITGPAARADGQAWRARACALLTGIGTVLADDPQLTVRSVETSRQPLRIVVDSQLRLPPHARLLADGCAAGPVLLVTASDDLQRTALLRSTGAEVLFLPNAAGQVDLPALCAELAARGLNEVHVEAGAGLNGALLRAGLVDEWLLYLAPNLIGEPARGLFAGMALTDLADKREWLWHDVRRVGRDLRLLLRPAPATAAMQQI